METTDILSLRPFEICSIRPPTENSSLTFRLTRNCYWNKCTFCPVYKFGAKFSKRKTEDVVADIDQAKALDDLMYEHGIGFPVYSSADYQKAHELVETIKRTWWEGGILIDDGDTTKTEDQFDSRLEWFLQWFKDKPQIEDCINQLLTWRISGGKTCFLGDSDSLILKPQIFESIIPSIRKNFPSIERFTIYGRTKSAAQLRSLKELKELRKLGLKRVHFGLESGNDKVLSYVQKGVTSEEQIRGLSKTVESGLSCSVYIMPGLGGKIHSEEHAYDTAMVINKSKPEYVRIRSLEIFPKTHLDEYYRNNEFKTASEEEVIKEIKILLETINIATTIYSDSASNLLPINGNLPSDRDEMLKTIDKYLNLDKREKLEFSLQSRLESFYGQYGYITDDIERSLNPYIRDNSIIMSNISDEAITEIITQIRGKLMP